MLIGKNMIKNEKLQRALLNRYTNAQAAKIIRCSREWAGQLRKQLKIPITSQEAGIQYNLRMKEQAYLRCMMNDNCKKLDNPSEWRQGKKFAIAHNLPWPPHHDPEEQKCVKIYRFAEKNPHVTWIQINQLFQITNSCAKAAQAARSHGFPWPLRGG